MCLSSSCFIITFNSMHWPRVGFYFLKKEKAYLAPSSGHAETRTNLSRPSVLWGLCNSFDVCGERCWLVRACVCLCQDLKPVDVTNKRSLWENKGASPTKVRTKSPPSPFSIRRAALRNPLPPPKWSVDRLELLCGLGGISSLSFSLHFHYLSSESAYFSASWSVGVLTRPCICLSFLFFCFKNSHS